jgi:hypothetical protein
MTGYEHGGLGKLPGTGGDRILVILSGDPPAEGEPQTATAHRGTLPCRDGCGPFFQSLLPCLVTRQPSQPAGSHDPLSHAMWPTSRALAALKRPLPRVP